MNGITIKERTFCSNEWHGNNKNNSKSIKSSIELQVKNNNNLDIIQEVHEVPFNNRESIENDIDYYDIKNIEDGDNNNNIGSEQNNNDESKQNMDEIGHYGV